MPNPDRPIPVATEVRFRFPGGPWGISILASPVIFLLIKITPGLFKFPVREETVELIALAVLFCTHGWACFLQRKRKGYLDPEGYGYFLLLFFGGFALMGLIGFALFILLLLWSFT